MKNTQSKKKNLISQLFTKKETPVVLPDYKEYLTVKIINDDDESITGTLGITDERKKELYALTKDGIENSENITSIFTDISTQITHPNELAFVCFLVGFKLGKEEADPFQSIIGAIIKGNNGKD